MIDNPRFNPDCRRCARLAGYLDDIRERHPDYYGRAVPAFGASRPRLFVVGLAPGLHGANRTGRPFTGDIAGELLYKSLYINHFNDRPVSEEWEDGLVLRDACISNAVRCVPPRNRPTAEEVDNCNRYLQVELRTLPPSAIIVALGTIAHRAVLKALGLKLTGFPFGHGAEHQLPSQRWLLDSYHCSRYNTQTRRLTEAMFHQVFRRARELVDG